MNLNIKLNCVFNLRLIRMEEFKRNKETMQISLITMERY